MLIEEGIALGLFKAMNELQAVVSIMFALVTCSHYYFGLKQCFSIVSRSENKVAVPIGHVDTLHCTSLFVD